jgi:uncharacterized protein YjiS (DUF1127 family)
MSTLELGDIAAPTSQHTGWLARLWAGWKRRRAQRLALLDLSRMEPRLLRDMGIEPLDVINALDGRGRSRLVDRVRQH